MRFCISVVVFSLTFLCTSCGTQSAKVCSSKAECETGQVCALGFCRAASADGGPPTTVFPGCDPSNPANDFKDTDCDGFTDAEEYTLSYGGTDRTDPCNADSDGDGVKDGLEQGRVSTVNATCGFSPDAEPSSQTDPTQADSDDDGLSDGEEDANKDGKVQGGESDPRKVDGDCDGISDFDERNGTKGCATDPLDADSDKDGLVDGVEQGLSAPGADVTGCSYSAGTFDAESSSKTNACAADTDGDGIGDGAEDLDKNGRVDAGELNPNNPGDAQGPAGQACSLANLKPIAFHDSKVADVQVALVPDFAEVRALKDGDGKDRGVAFYDDTHKVAGFVISRAPIAANASAEETADRARLQALGALSGALTQTFTTWDGFPESVRATYTQAGTDELKARLNQILKDTLGTQTTGLLQGSSGQTGPFKIQVQWVRRTANRSVLVLAITPAPLFAGAQLFRLDDVAGGSALAQFGDFDATQCEVFTTQGNANVDFLWVVDNSCSMNSSQTAVANVGSLFSQKLNNAGLNWRVAGVATDGQNSTPFQTSIAPSFFTNFGTTGNGMEQALLWSRNKTQGMLPRTANDSSRIRPDADLHVILLADADDQSGVSWQSYRDFFLNYDGTGARAVVHGIVCPENAQCGLYQGNYETNPIGARVNLPVIQATGGVAGDINSASNVNDPSTEATLDAILTAAISGTGKQLGRPPIAATLKVAIEANGTVGSCDTQNVPRDRVNGFDFDSASRRVVFYGNCRPNGPGRKVAVSYRYWNDGSPYPGGDPCDNQCAAPLVCDASSKQCVCPPDCGGCAEGLSCSVQSCTCVGLN